MVKRISYIILVLLVSLVALLPGFLSNSSPAARAAAAESEKTYSNVLDDLKKDSNFDPSYYAADAADNSLQVIQIAESVDKELFIYVYQPSGESKDITASSINMSTTVGDDINYLNYKLELLNSSGVFFKYIVKGFEVLSFPTRYYAFSSIYRPWNRVYDKDPGYENTVSEVPYAVNKQYCFSTVNGQPYVSVVDIETIEVTDKFVGFVRYSDGVSGSLGFLGPTHIEKCDSHFVAFNTDKKIDNLLEADVYYTTQDYRAVGNAYRGMTDGEFTNEKEDKYAYLTYTQKVEHTGSGWFAGTYKWDRIETVEQFLKENDVEQNVYSGGVINATVSNIITEEGKGALKGKKWVLRFTETEYKIDVIGPVGWYEGTMVGDVSILRLKFETDGITYNLGVIDNKQTGSEKPINKEDLDIDVNIPWWVWLLVAVGIILLLIILSIFFPVLIPVIKAIFKALWWLICLPFRFIAWVVKKIKERRANRPPKEPKE